MPTTVIFGVRKINNADGGPPDRSEAANEIRQCEKKNRSFQENEVMSARSAKIWPY